MKDVEVTVYCLVYNHEKFLRDCLEGFVNQKTNFRFKVIVHDDASTDNSADIIREYAEKYPEIIEPIYQTENQYSKGVKIVPTYIYPRMEGKYIAICEGDDFWNDENKLQRQYDALEENPDIHFCVCRVREIAEDGTPLGFSKPQDKRLKNGRVPAELVVQTNAETCYQFQTSGYFFRKDTYDKYIEKKYIYYVKCNMGDIQLVLYFSHLSDTYFIDEELSSHRNTNSNWSADLRANPEKKLRTFVDGERIYRNFDRYTNKRFHKYAIHRIKVLRQGYVHFCLEHRMYDKITAIKHWKYYENKKELIYCLMKVYAPKLLELIGKAD